MNSLRKIEFVSHREAESRIGRKDEDIIYIMPRESKPAALVGDWLDIRPDFDTAK